MIGLPVTYRRFAAALIAAGVGCAAMEAPAADPNKILHWEFRASETGFDPARVTDYYSNTVIEAVFERLLTYDYLARPAKLVPEAAASMPEITDNGKTFLFRLRRGAYFAPDAAFKGVRREMTAADVAYSIKRHMDPGTARYWQWLVEGKIVGLDELAKAATSRGARSITTRRSRDSRSSTATPCASGSRDRLQLCLHPGDAGAVDRRARGDRGLRRGHQRASGRHRAVPAGGLGARVEDQARGESQIITASFGASSPAPTRATARSSRA